MLRSRLRTALLIGAAALMATGVSSALCDRAWAGGVTFDSPDDTDANAGPPFNGIVRDRGGSPVNDAKVTVTVKIFNSSLILRTDADGHFTVNGFDKSVKSDDVQIACSKDGYKQFAEARRSTGSGPQSPIQVTCILQKVS